MKARTCISLQDAATLNTHFPVHEYKPLPWQRRNRDIHGDVLEPPPPITDKTAGQKIIEATNASNSTKSLGSSWHSAETPPTNRRPPLADTVRRPLGRNHTWTAGSGVSSCPGPLWDAGARGGASAPPYSAVARVVVLWCGVHYEVYFDLWHSHVNEVHLATYPL